jgi:hypothetical protein
MTAHEAVVTTLYLYDFLLPWRKGDEFDLEPEFLQEDIMLVTEWHIYHKEGGLLCFIWYFPDRDYNNSFAICDFRKPLGNCTIPHCSFLTLLETLNSDEFKDSNFAIFTRDKK